MPLLLILFLGLGGVGCRGIYHESAEIYPPNSDARLKLRIHEARQAQTQADQAAARLCDRVVKGPADPQVEADIDRLELEAREFGRRVAAVSDAVSSSGQPAQFGAEIRQLQQRANRILGVVEKIRSDGVASTLPLLEELLHD